MPNRNKLVRGMLSLASLSMPSAGIWYRAQLALTPQPMSACCGQGGTGFEAGALRLNDCLAGKCRTQRPGGR